MGPSRDRRRTLRIDWVLFSSSRSRSQHLMKRIQRGPVRGISLKLQEEERERRMDFVPEKSALEVESIEVDKDTMDMLKSMNMGNLPGVSVSSRGGYSKGPRREPRA